MAIAADTSIGERRSARRVPVRRKAVIICAEGAVPHVTGTAVDMSRDGLGIRVYQPLPRGQAIDIELEPKEGKPQTEEIRVRGRVARVQVLGARDCVLGISFTRNAWPAVPVHARLKLISPEVAGLRMQPTEGRRHERRFARAIPGILLLLLLCLLGLLWPGDSPTVRAARSSDVHERPSSPETLSPKRDTNDATNAKEEDGELPQLVALPPLSGFAASTSTAVQGDYALEAKRGVLTAEGPPTPQTIAGEGYAGIPAVLGEVLEGGEPGSVAAGGQTVGTKTVSAGGGPRNAEGVSEDVAEPRSHAKSKTGEDVLLVVDRAAFRMRVYRNGRLAAEFPVGVGRDDSTPVGEFTIANKISRPAWFHRGETVPYGDLRNPLGESWMGFALNGVPMSYGIHPTSDPASIGAATGAGCVRMRPSDAASLFRLCPRGATVRICDGPPTDRAASLSQ